MQGLRGGIRPIIAIALSLVLGGAVFILAQGGPSIGLTTPPSTTTTSTLSVSSTTTSTLSVSSTTALLTVDDGSYDAVVRPGDSIQAVVDGLPAGSRILIGSGVHVGQQVEPKRGMTFVGEKGAVLDGGGSTNYAFLAWEGSGATDVTIRGLEIRNYKPLFEYHGAIMVRVTGWIVEDCDINNNAYSGVYVSGESIVRNCYIHRNGRLGVKVGGGSRNTLIENNEIAYNNINNVFDPTWEAGGLKVAGTSGSTGLVIRGNNIHDNRGPGIWIDVNAVNIVIEDNLVENNDTNGIDYEISSYGVIRNNTVRNNGYKHPSLGWMWGAGITIRGSNVEVYGNTVENNYNGIGIIDTGRPNVVVDNINVYNNTVTGSANWQAGAVPGASSPDDGLFSRNIRFENNTYDGGTFRWLNTSLTLAEWQAFGHDTPN